MRRILLSILKILISAALLYLALRKVDFANLASRLNWRSLAWLFLAVAVAFLQIFVGVLRWRVPCVGRLTRDSTPMSGGGGNVERAKGRWRVAPGR